MPGLKYFETLGTIYAYCENMRNALTHQRLTLLSTLSNCGQQSCLGTSTRNRVYTLSDLILARPSYMSMIDGIPDRDAIL